jgi:ribosomal protein S6--L-glutamate ligase
VPPAEMWLLTDRRYLRQRMPSAVVEWLGARGIVPRLVVADDGGLVCGLDASSSELDSPWRELAPGDVVVTRSRHPFALALLEQAEALGAWTWDRSSAVLVVRDKIRCTAALVRCGIPVPPTFLARRPVDLARLPREAFPLVLKPVLGDNGRGLHVVEAPEQLASITWSEQLVLAQRYVEAGGVDLKVYVAGEEVWAVRRPSPLSAEPDTPVAAPVTPALRDLVRACQDEFGLLLFGLDVLESSDGPVVVDVNEFPNYTGVEEAPEVIGRLLLREAGRPTPPPRRTLHAEPA